MQYLPSKSFHKNKKFSNRTDWKNNEDEFIKFIDSLLKKFKYIKNMSFNQVTDNGRIFRFHPWDYEHYKYALDVIKDCHPEIYEKIEQNILSRIELEYVKKDEIKAFYSFHAKKGIPIFCIVLNEELFPLLFDLNHCFYKDSKNYPYKYKNHFKDWDFDKDILEQKLIKF